jgi:hypothetical protein
MDSSSNSFAQLTQFLQQLDAEQIYHSLSHHREESVMVNVAVPGQRWEVEFFVDGSVEVERFVSAGDILGAEALVDLFEKFGDAAAE